MQCIVNHKCGHSEAVQLYGKAADRQRKLAWLASQNCKACEAEQRAKVAKAAGLPTLVGSPRQVDWAESIRAQKLRELAKIQAQVEVAPGTDEEKAIHLGAIQAVHNKRDSIWWIDNRNESIYQLIKAELAR